MKNFECQNSNFDSKNNPPSPPFRKGGLLDLLPLLKGGWEGLGLKK